MQTCAQTDTTGLTWIQQKLHPAKAPLIFQSTAAAFVAVQIGRCDAIILDTPIVASEKKARPSRYGAVAGQIVTKEQYGARAAEGLVADAARRRSGRQALEERHDRGKLQKKWFNIDFSKIPNPEVKDRDCTRSSRRSSRPTTSGSRSRRSGRDSR